MNIPETFTNHLEADFQGRLRARWSPSQQAVVIEQKVARSIIGSVPRKVLTNERRQSLAEGYKLVMTVAASETIRCPKCNYHLQAPKMETKEIVCLQCRLMGKSGKVIAGYYPLNHILLTHLKKIDPLRDMNNDVASRIVEQNEKLAEKAQQKLFDDATAYSNDNFNRLVGIQQVGHTGKENMWIRD